jgi:hypothetical protein
VEDGAFGHQSGKEDRPELARLLADQFGALDDTRPGRARAECDRAVLVFTFDWPLLPADELLAGAGRADQMSDFRLTVLANVAPSLAELVELDLRRQVVSTSPSLGPGGRDVGLSFTLGNRLLIDREGVEGLRNWARQVRRRTGARRQVLRRVREELARARRRWDRD